MNTHYLGIEEVQAYCRDLITRLKSPDIKMPTLWCPIGESGRRLVDQLLAECPDLVPTIELLEVDYDRNSDQVTFKDGDPSQDLPGKLVLVLDSSVHSGTTMFKVVRAVAGHKPTAICSYSLVVKRSASFIPSFWGVSIDDHDRAYFLLKELPNNRLDTKDPYVHIRRLAYADIHAAVVDSGLASMDRQTWADRYYNMETRGRSHQTYVLEAGATILGYVSFTFRDDVTMDLDEVAVDRKYQGKGYASALMRWAETSARQNRVHTLRLWGVDQQVTKYEHMGYQKEDGKRMDLDDGAYYFMTKRVLYHL